MEHLLRVYGARAPEVLASAATPELREIFDPFSGAIAAEVPWAYNEEGARTLVDVIARRTMVGLGPDAGIGADVAAAKIAWDALGWDTAKLDAEVDFLPALGQPLPPPRPGTNHNQLMTTRGIDPGTQRQFVEYFPRPSNPDRGHPGGSLGLVQWRRPHVCGMCLRVQESPANGGGSATDLRRTNAAAHTHGP